MFSRKKKTTRLATDVESMQAQADDFLVSQGFPVNKKYRQVFGTFVQHLPNNEDEFCPEDIAKAIRRAEANEAAYYGLINPPPVSVVEAPTDTVISEQSTTENATDKVEAKVD